MNTRTRTSEARNPRAETRNPASGFTLVELLIAMFILAIGLSAVVSVFYAAANLQQRAFDAVTTEQVKNNAKAMITSRGLDQAAVIASLTGSWDTDGRVHRLGNQSGNDMLEAGAAPEDRWPLALRAHPLADAQGADPDALDRDFYWIPLVRDIDPSGGAYDWRVYVFVVHKGRDDMRPEPSDFTYGLDHVANPDDDGTVSGTDHYLPRVYGLSASYDGVSSLTMTESAGDYLRVGDPVLIGTGTTATVIAIDDDTITLNAPHGLSSGSTTIWFAAPPFPDAPSPTGFILTLGDNAVKP